MTQIERPARRAALRTGAALAAGLAAGAARAQGADFPKGPVRLRVALPPGGAADVSARALQGPLEQAWKQSVIVENRPGGQFQIAMQALAAAPADGHTLLHVFNSFASVHAVQKLFDLETQVIPVTRTSITPIVLLVRGNSPHRTLADLVAFGRANPGKLTYSTLGPGSVEHLKMAQIEKAGGFQGVAVPYRGGPDSLKALIGGEIDFQITAGIFAKQFAPSGQVRVLATLEPTRWTDFPDVPTMAEAGVAVPPMTYWGGYVVRAGTPSALVDRLRADLAAAAVAQPVVERLAAAGGLPSVSPSREDFRKLIASEIAWMGAAAKELGL
ncbi:MAG: tripartite tricarboxylate transporter substrate binding protein [Burkholderiales bacterium]